eukprot:scaffold676749_cov60-Prasinocladus_malaysianus.AAC.1
MHGCNDYDDHMAATLVPRVLIGRRLGACMSKKRRVVIRVPRVGVQQARSTSRARSGGRPYNLKSVRKIGRYAIVVGKS